MFRLMFRKLKNAPGRWLAIALAVLLAAGLWSGFFAAGSALLQGSRRFARQQNLHDLVITANCGFTQAEVDTLLELESVAAAEGSVTVQGILEDADGVIYEAALRQVTAVVDLPDVTAGRLPEAPDECVLDAAVFSRSAIGTTVTLQDCAAAEDYQVVGLAHLPENYMPAGRFDGVGVQTVVLLQDAAPGSDSFPQLRLILTEDADRSAVEAAVRDVVYRRHATLLAQIQAARSLAQQELDAANAVYDEEFSQEAMELSLLQAASREATTAYEQALNLQAALEQQKLEQQTEAARIEAEEAAIQRDEAAYQEERQRRIAELEEAEDALDVAHYEMEMSVYNLEVAINELEAALSIAGEADVRDALEDRIREHREEIQAMQRAYEEKEQAYLAQEAEFESWRTEMRESLDRRAVKLEQDRETLEWAKLSRQAQEELNLANLPALEETASQLQAQAEMAETELLTRSMDVLQDIGAARDKLDGLNAEALRLEEPEIFYEERQAGLGYSRMYRDGFGLRQAAPLFLAGSLLLVLCACMYAAREELRSSETARKTLARMGVKPPVLRSGICAAGSAAVGAVAGGLLGGLLGLWSAAAVFGGSYAAPIAVPLSLLWNVLLLPVLWGAISFGVTCLWMRRCEKRAPIRCGSLYFLDEIPGIWRRVLASPFRHPHRFLAVCLCAFHCACTLCLVLGAAGGRVTARNRQLTAVGEGLYTVAETVAESTPLGRYQVWLSLDQGKSTRRLWVLEAEEMDGACCAISGEISRQLDALVGDSIHLTLSDDTAFQCRVERIYTDFSGADIVISAEVFQEAAEREAWANAALLRGSEEELASMEISAPLQPVETVLPPLRVWEMVLLILCAVLVPAAFGAGLWCLHLPGAKSGQMLLRRRRLGVEDRCSFALALQDHALGTIVGTGLGLGFGAALTKVFCRAVTVCGQNLQSGNPWCLVFAGVLTLLGAAAGLHAAEKLQVEN